MPQREIRAICFDIGGVLVRMPRGVLASELAELLDADIEKVRDLLIVHAKTRRTSTVELATIIATACGRPQAADTVADRLRLRIADMADPPLYPDVIPTLEQLAGLGFRICLLSNAIGPDPDTAPARPPYFALAEVVLHSWQIGECKPHLAAFRAIESAMDLAPQQLLNVGDSSRFDIDGALAAGWSAIHLVRNSATPAHPDVARIGALTDLAPLLS
ncbi:HAD family hydrolase [Nocardia takedensis]|uniref:HAD family hydrolase n=1 Tax=Nocardia takedensis TaxID=259390 RepID=UPI003F776F74